MQKYILGKEWQPPVRPEDQKKEKPPAEKLPE